MAGRSARCFVRSCPKVRPRDGRIDYAGRRICQFRVRADSPALPRTVFRPLWARPGLDVKTRTLVCVVSDAATGAIPTRHRSGFVFKDGGPKTSSWRCFSICRLCGSRSCARPCPVASRVFAERRKHRANNESWRHSMSSELSTLTRGVLFDSDTTWPSPRRRRRLRLSGVSEISCLAASEVTVPVRCPRRVPAAEHGYCLDQLRPSRFSAGCTVRLRLLASSWWFRTAPPC